MTRLWYYFDLSWLLKTPECEECYLVLPLFSGAQSKNSLAGSELWTSDLRIQVSTRPPTESENRDCQDVASAPTKTQKGMDVSLTPNLALGRDAEY